jgi:DNA polymerase-3 subunit gamma/tau
MAETQPPHLVLARKWRPERFSELVGQEHVTRTLSEALKRGRISHAFLFTGIRGVGKTTAARILARCLNCERGPTPEPCGECAACVEIRAGRSLDVSEIDGATYRKIDDARAIIENLSYRPARDRFKIYIIDEAHQLTDQAFNALLKTLEEPPAHVKFILATTEPQKMPETILSRLQRYDFRRIALATIFERLRDLVAREEIKAEESALRLIAREAGGSMRDAERMLETAIASVTGAEVSEAEVAAALGVASRTTVFKLAESILDRNAAPALRFVREMSARGANLESLGRDILETLRNLAVAMLPADGGQSPLDDIPDHEAQELRRLAEKVSARDVMRLFRLMASAQEEIIRSPYPDLLLEMAVVRMASLAPVLDADELMRALGAAGRGSPSSGGAGPGGGSGMRGASAEAPAQAPAGGTRRLRVEGEVKAGAVARASAPTSPVPASSAPRAGGGEMPELREHIRARRAALWGFMEGGAALAMAGEVLTVTPLKDIYVRYLSDSRAVIAELASEFFGRPIRVEIGGADSAAPPAGAVEPPRESEAAAPEPAPQPDRDGAAPASSALRAAADAITNGRAASPNGGATPAQQPRGSSADERAALYSDPSIRRIFDALEARLVEIRAPRPAAPEIEDPESDADSQD